MFVPFRAHSLPRVSAASRAVRRCAVALLLASLVWLAPSAARALEFNSITYDSQRDDAFGQPGIWMMNEKGGEQHGFVPGGSESSWSEDGSKMLYLVAPEWPHCLASGSTGGAIFVVNAEGGDPQQVGGACGDARISPDGTHVVYDVSPDQLAVTSLTSPFPTTRIVSVANVSQCSKALGAHETACEFGTEPSWDGKNAFGNSHVVYSDDTSEGGGLWLLPSNGSSSVPVKIANENTESGLNYGISGMSVSPSGTALVASVSFEGTEGESINLIREGETMGTVLAAPPPGHNYVFPQWAPNASEIVFEDDGPEGSTIDSVKISGGPVTVLTPNDHTARNPTFAPTPATGKIEGSVIDAATQKGLAHVAVQIAGAQQTDTVFTNSSGTFSDELPPGSYTIAPQGAPEGESPGGSYATILCNGTTGAGDCMVELTGGGQKSADFAYGPTASIDGHITDVTGKGGVAGVAVAITGTDIAGNPVSQNAVSGEDGSFVGGPLPLGTYTATVSSPPPAPATPGGRYTTNRCDGTTSEVATTGSQQLSCALALTEASATKTASFAYSCAGVRVDSATPLAEAPFGALLDTPVQIKGAGFCAGTTVRFGNERAAVTVASADLAADGSSATVLVPQLATTGKLTVKANGAEGSLADPFAIDSFRDTNGFAFANTGHITNLDEFEAAFGLEQTMMLKRVPGCPPGKCKLVEVPRPQAQAFFASKAAGASFASGVCYGIDLASQKLTDGDPGPASFGDAKVPWELGTAPSPALASFIGSQHWLQWSDQVKETTDAQARDPHREGGAIHASLSSEVEHGARSAGAIVEIFQRNSAGQEQGHALLAYALEEASGQAGAFFIDVYDPNLPFSEAENALDGGLHLQQLTGATKGARILVAPDGHWSYGPLGWSGAPQALRVVPYDVAGAAPKLGALAGNVDVTVSPDATVSALQDGTGHALDLAEPAVNGIVPDPVLDASAPATSSFIAPLGAYTQTVSSQGPLSELIEAPSLDAGLQAGGGTSQVSFNPATSTVALTPAGAAAAARGGRAAARAARAARAGATTTLSLIAHTAGGDHTVVVSGAGLDAGLRLAFDRSADRVTLAVPGKHGGSYTVTLSADGGGGVPETFTSPPLALRGGSTLTLSPRSWSSLSGARVSATLTGRGHRARRLRLRDRTRAPRSPIVGLADVHGALHAKLRVPALPATSSIHVFLTVAAGKKILSAGEATVPAGVAGVRSLSFALPARLPAGARARVLALTLAGGPAPTASTAARTLRLRR